MRLNPSITATLFRTELRMVFRDRRMLLTSIVLPLLVTPLMFLGSTWTIKKRERSLQAMVYHYSIAGTEAETVRGLLAATKSRLSGPTDSELKGSSDTSKPANPQASSRDGKQNQAATFKFEEVLCNDASEALRKGDIHLYLEGLKWEDARQTNQAPKQPVQSKKSSSRKSAGAKVGSTEDDGETPINGTLVVRLVFRGDRDESAAGMSRMQDALVGTRRVQRRELLGSHGLLIRPTEVASIVENDLATKAQVAGLSLGRSLTVLLMLFILTSGAVVATDSLAGEKERGTLETLLTTAASREEILAAKHLVILAVALLITLIQSANLLVYIGFRLMPVPPNLAAAVPAWMALLLFLLFLPVAALAANVLLLISGYARTYKEAQMYFLPVFLIGLVPALAAFLPGVPLRSAIVVVPIANIAVAVKEVLVGTFDWGFILMAWLVTAGCAVWTTRIGVRFLSTERLLTAAETDAAEFTGGRALFERHTVRWFAVLWALLLIVSNYGEGIDLRLQVLINLVGLFFGASLLILWRYRLDPRTTLALRAPKPFVWLGVLCAVPGGLITALGLAQLSNYAMPVSTKMTESFNQGIIPDKIPLAQLLFFLTVMPAIFEEITFRGVLLSSLHRRYHPAVVALVVGLVFSFFHVALFRFVPTACLGVLLAAVTLLSGSIFPGMLWHCLNNAAGILMYKLQIPETGLEPQTYAIGLALLALAFWIFWRNRSPYPNLRPWRSEALVKKPA